MRDADGGGRGGAGGGRVELHFTNDISGGRIFSRVDEAFVLLPLRLFVFLSVGRSERRFLRDDDASERVLPSTCLQRESR